MRRSNLPGRATPQGTVRGSERFSTGARRLGATGWSVSPVSLAVHATATQSPLIRRAFDDALRGGINLVVVDAPTEPEHTAPLEALGAAIAGAVEHGDLARDELVLALRIPNDDPADASAQMEARIAAWIESARRAVAIDTFDVVLYELAPESVALRWDERITSSSALGEHVRIGLDIAGWAPDVFAEDRGDIIAAWQGVFGSVRPPELLCTSLEMAGASGHPWGEPTVDRGVAWVARDPTMLRVRVGETMRTLAWGTWAEATPEARAVDEALAELRKEEARWATGLGKRLVTANGRDDAVDLFAWGRQIPEILPTLESQSDPLEAWQRLRHEQVGPLVGRTSAALLGALEGPVRTEFADWWQRYGTLLHRVFDAIERWLKNRGRSPVALAQGVLSEHLPDPCRVHGPALQTVLAGLSHPIASVVVEMSDPTTVLALAALRDAAAALEAVADRRFDFEAVCAKIAHILVDRGV